MLGEKIMKKAASFITALLIISSSVVTSFSSSIWAEGTENSDSYALNVNVDISDKGQPISPYIFGINDHGLDDNATANSIRQGGNRYSGYNWETNYSNAGSDWKNSSDDYLSTSDVPGACATKLSSEAEKAGIAYKLATLQMAGYVSADKDGTVTEAEKAPSKRWNEVKFDKDGELSLEPDLTDGVVYMEEYVNYLVKTLGDAKTSKGIQAYSLDNEPALWSGTHSLIHSDTLSCKELIDKSIELAKVVKSVDKNAEVFGPALYGYTAFDHLQDDEEWKAEYAGKYDWFVSYYLDQMKKAEEETGERLLDVFDIHYYTEAKGTCGTRMCSDPTHTECIDEMLQSYRTLCEKDYKENSWIGEYCQANIPILSRMQESIEKYYPGTKLAISEYSFGGGDCIAGGIAEIDALGTFAKNNVYFATIWADSAPYQFSGINMFTNYDGQGSAFGDTLIESKTDDYIKSTSYAAVDNDDKGDVNVIVTNKSQTQTEKATINLENTDIDYKNAAVYILSGDSSEIRHKESIKEIDNNKFTIDIPPLSAVQILITDDENSYRPVKNPRPDTSISKEKVSGEVTGEGKEYKVVFDDEIGDTAIIDMTLASGVPMASGAIAFSVKYNGIDYWVPCGWSTTKSGEVTVDINKPDSAYNSADETTSEDEELLAELAEIIKKEKKADLQIWYVADSAWENIDPSNVTINNVYMLKECEVSMYGDLNADKQVDLTDLIMLSLHLLGDSELSDNSLRYADVNGDGEVDILDLPYLRQYIMHDPVTLGPKEK